MYKRVVDPDAADSVNKRVHVESPEQEVERLRSRVSTMEYQILSYNNMAKEYEDMRVSFINCITCMQQILATNDDKLERIYGTDWSNKAILAQQAQRKNELVQLYSDFNSKMRGAGYACEIPVPPPQCVLNPNVPRGVEEWCIYLNCDNQSRRCNYYCDDHQGLYRDIESDYTAHADRVITIIRQRLEAVALLQNKHQKYPAAYEILSYTIARHWLFKNLQLIQIVSNQVNELEVVTREFYTPVNGYNHAPFDLERLKQKLPALPAY